MLGLEEHLPKGHKTSLSLQLVRAMCCVCVWGGGGGRAWGVYFKRLKSYGFRSQMHRAEFGGTSAHRGQDSVSTAAGKSNVLYVWGGGWRGFRGGGGGGGGGEGEVKVIRFP